MLSDRFPHYRRRPVFIFGAAFLICMALLICLLVTGCHPDADLSPASVTAAADVPKSFPPTPAVFATVMAVMPTPEQQVDQAPLPLRPPDPSHVAVQAAGPAAAPVTKANQGLNAGLIVCDPVSASPALTQFGTACGRWLDLMAAGQPELGRTPFWESRTRARREMGRTDFQLSPAQAAPLAAMTGATDAACGTLSGSPSRCTLKYRLVALPGGLPVGPAVVVCGTEAQIAGALPGLAKTLDTQLGVRAPHVSASVGLSAAELTQVETIGDEERVSDADLLTLLHLSARCPLAGMYLVGTRAVNDQILLNGIVKTLLSQLPDNTLVLSHLGYAEPAALRLYAPATRALILRWPANALLAHTEAWEQRLWGDRVGEWSAAVRICRDSPRDPSSWLTRTTTLQNIGNDLRQGRLAGDLSPADWSVLNRLYSQQEEAALQATALDPKEGHSWFILAETATFFGDSAREETAFQKALALDDNKEEVYGWGLQMYQPKWTGTGEASLAHIAALAAAEKWDNANAAEAMAASLTGAGFGAQGTQVLTDFIARQRALLVTDPADALLHWDLAGALAAQKTPPSLLEATREYRTAAHLMPNAPAIYRWLGDVLDQRHQSREAIAEYRKALALDPFSVPAHLNLGFLLKREERFGEALPELRLAMRLDPRNADVHYALGEMLNRQGQYKSAAAEYSEAIRMSFYSIGAWVSLPGMLDQSGRYDETLRAGQMADHVLTEQRQADSETEPAIHDAMSDADLHKKAWQASISESHVSLSYNPKDACAEENLAEAYCGEGRLPEARAQWGRTITMGDPRITPVAAKLLAAHS